MVNIDDCDDGMDDPPIPSAEPSTVCRVQAKPKRIAVTAPDSPVPKRPCALSKRTTHPWESVEADPTEYMRVLNTALTDHAALLKLSFLGLTNSDLKAVFDATQPLCFNDGRAVQVQIDLNNNRITELDDDVLERLSLIYTSKLDLSFNKLERFAIPTSSFQSLRILKLTSNNLESVSNEVCDLENLETLDLSRNNLTYLPPHLCRLKKLEILNVAGNCLTQLPEDIAEEDSELYALDVSDNPDIAFFPSCCKHWSKLVQLKLADTKVSIHLFNKDQTIAPSLLMGRVAGLLPAQLEQRRKNPKTSKLPASALRSTEDVDLEATDKMAPVRVAVDQREDVVEVLPPGSENSEAL